MFWVFRTYQGLQWMSSLQLCMYLWKQFFCCFDIAQLYNIRISVNFWRSTTPLKEIELQTRDLLHLKLDVLDYIIDMIKTKTFCGIKKYIQEYNKCIQSAINVSFNITIVLSKWRVYTDIEQIQTALSACSIKLKTQVNVAFMSMRNVWGLDLSPCETDGEWAVLIESRPKGSTEYWKRKNWLYRQPCPWMFGCCLKRHTPTLFFWTIFFFISHSVFIPPVSGLFPSLSRVSLPEGPPLGEWIR